VYLVVSFCACSSPPKDQRHALIDQFLVAVESKFPLLCNRAFDKETNKIDFSCVNLRDQKQREILWNLKMVCKVADKIYAVSKDRPGLVRNFLENGIKIEDYQDMESIYPLLIASNAVCFSEERYPLDTF